MPDPVRTANEQRLRDGGHTYDGRCEKCWSDAASLYANGQGNYESHTAAYYAVMVEAERRAAKEETMRTIQRAEMLCETRGGRSHCWHDTGHWLLSDPPQAGEICCCCGLKRRLVIKAALGDPKGHGPYHPGCTIEGAK